MPSLARIDALSVRSYLFKVAILLLLLLSPALLRSANAICEIEKDDGDKGDDDVLFIAAVDGNDVEGSYDEVVGNIFYTSRYVN